MLISESYKNLDTGLELLCPNKHQVNITYGDWRAAAQHECPICIRTPFTKKNEKPTNKKGYRILALDQASITSGWSLFIDGELANFGKYTSNGSKSTQRISEVKAWLDYMISTHKPQEVILEDIQLQKNDGSELVITFKKLAHLQGVLKNYLYEHGIPYQIVPPPTWRNYSNIKGKQRTDQKRNAQLKVQALYDIEVENDIADAILIGRWAAAQHRNSDIITF